MDRLPFSKRVFVATTLMSLVIVVVSILSSYRQDGTKIVFCDVGQGDAAYIRTREKVDIVIDAGPSSRVLDCLGRHMPFHDRTIELAFLTHPQKDHHAGFRNILERYSVDHFITVPVMNQTIAFNELVTMLVEDATNVSILTAGDRVNIGKRAHISMLWPTEEYLGEHISESGERVLLNKSVLGASDGVDVNNFSQIFLYREDSFEILFTGDTTVEILANIVGWNEQIVEPLEILKVPHHGSKHGLTADFLKLADPAVSVISAGKNNSYGHPAVEILDLFKAFKLRYYSTADDGDVVVVYDGNGWTVK